MAAPSAPRPRRCGPRSARRPRRRRRSRSRHSRDRAAADGSARPISCRSGLRSRPSNGAGTSRANGLEVVRMNSRKAAPIQPCTASTLARSVAGRLRAEGRDQGAEEGQDQHPQQHRAFVVAPGAGELVEHRLQRMRILPDIGDREIRLHIGRRQRGEGDRRQRESRQRRPVRRPPSAAHRRSARRPAAPPTAPAPARRPAQARNGPISTMGAFSCSGCVELTSRTARSPSIRLPDALFLQAVGDFLRHIGLVVLGKHAVGDEHAVGAEACLR